MQSKILKRKRIDQKLTDIYRFPLTIIEAPAGYGKTTAVRNFFTEHSKRALWIYCQKEKISTGYWAKFADSISRIDGSAGSALKNMGYPANAPQRNKALSILNTVDFVRPTAIVFDNYELIKDTQFSQLLIQIAEDEIENLQLVVITRDTTEIDFITLLSKGKCCVISQQQIKFTSEEINDYCIMMINSISKNDIKKIADYTDGWISMIYILLLGVKEHIPIGLNSTLEELIDKTLFSIHEADIRQFLLELSIMGNFTSKQAEWVTGRKNAGELLKSLQKKNSFLYFDSQEKTYRIHPVLLDFLRPRQDFSNEQQKELYHRLGEWYLQHNDLLEAYAYLARAGEAEKILLHLNDTAPIRNLYTDFEGADELFSSVSKEVLFNYPIAYLRYLFYSVVILKKEMIEELTERLDELEVYYLGKQDMDIKRRDHILAEILCVRKFTEFNRLEKMHTYNDKIIRLLNGKQSSIMLNVNEFTFGSPHYLYIYFRDVGTLKLITSISQKNSHTFFSDGCGMGSDSLATAEYACETCDFQTAILESRKAIYKAETKSQWSVVICAKFNMTRVVLALGKIHTAHEILQQLCDDAEASNSPIYSSMAQLCRGYVYSSLDMPDSIPLWLKTGDLSSLSMFFGGMGFDKLVYAKALLAQGEYLKLEALSDSFDLSFSVFQNRLGFIHNAILRAAAKYHLYGTDNAVPALVLALDMARPDEIILPFAECATHLLPVFKAMPKESRKEEFTVQVLTVCKKYADNLKDLLPEKPKLTGRETEILKLLAEGLSRNKIAEHLTISPGTVKTHTQSIYRKLGADGRASAVKIAWSNGFLT